MVGGRTGKALALRGQDLKVKLGLRCKGKVGKGSHPCSPNIASKCGTWFCISLSIVSKRQKSIFLQSLSCVDFHCNILCRISVILCDYTWLHDTIHTHTYIYIYIHEQEYVYTIYNILYSIYATSISLRHSRDFQPCFSRSPQFTDPPLSVFHAVGPLRLLRCWSQQFLSQRGSWLPVKAQEDRQSWKSWGEISSWKKAGIMEKRDPFFGGNQTWYKYCWKKNWGIIVQLVWVGHIMNPGNLAWELKHRVILEDCVFSLEQRGWFLGSIFR